MYLFVLNSRETASFRDSFLARAPGHSFANGCDAIRQLVAGLTGEGTRSAFPGALSLPLSKRGASDRTEMMDASQVITVGAEATYFPVRAFS